MLELKNIQKRYDYQKVLDNVSIVFPEIGMVGIVGPSGCGKSTLLNIIGGIDQDFFGDILYQGQSMRKHLTRYRKKYVSFIFQQLHLVMWLSVNNNIHISQYFHKKVSLSKSLDITNLSSQKISSLSLGQRQKIAYLRACWHNQSILLCDEPTGSLDPQQADMIMQMLKEESQKKLVIIVSHDLSLVEKYCDEMYEMKDGNIVCHQQYQQTFPLLLQDHSSQKKIRFPLFRLSLYSLLSHKNRTFQMIFGFSLSLLCILITLTMSQGLEKQIQNYIYSLIPPSSISVKSSQSSLDEQFIEDISKIDSLKRVHLFLDDYECLGIGFVKERYQQSQTLFIGDDTSPYESFQLDYGMMPSRDSEVLLSHSTAMHLCEHEDLKKLIGQKIYAWYKVGHQVKAIEYRIVGITKNTTSIDTLYQQANAYIHLLENEKIIKNPISHTAILFVDQQSDRSHIVKVLSQKYPQYQFVETGASTIKQVTSTMKKVKTILYLFSSLAILSSVSLIGEVMFLNAIQKKKDYAIMQCFGAGMFDFIKLIFCESVEIVSVSIILVGISYLELIQLLNQFLKEFMINNTIVFMFDMSLFIKICIIASIIVLISQITPLVYTIRLNTVETLRN